MNTKMSFEIIEPKEQKKKKEKKSEWSKGTCGSLLNQPCCIVEVSEGGETEGKGQSSWLFEEIMPEHFLNLGKDMGIQLYDVLQVGPHRDPSMIKLLKGK